jgi:multimeric flavodoxin WrbA
MKLLAFVGSPRKEGNTAVLVREIVRAAQEHEAETEIIYLNDLTMRGCQGCMGCKKTGRCVLKDDMTPLYDQIIAADVMVLGSPVYGDSMTGQLKIFMDRLYPFFNTDLTSNLPKGKKAALVFTQGWPQADTYTSYFQTVAEFLRVLGFTVCRKILVGAGLLELGAVVKDTATMEAARALGRQLCGG